MYIRDKLGRFARGYKPSKNHIDKLIKQNKKRAKPLPLINCEICNKEFKVYHYRAKSARFCSASCKGIWVGQLRRERAKPIKWGQYMFIKIPNHYRANKQGYVKFCDLVAEKKINRKLKNNEVVHHINEDKFNDEPENLEVMDKKEHDSYHSRKRWNKVWC